jgi:hypothetical protein
MNTRRTNNVPVLKQRIEEEIQNIPTTPAQGDG